VEDQRIVEAPPAGSAQGKILERLAEAENYNGWLFDRSRHHLGRRVLDVGAGLGTFCETALPGRELVVALEPDPAFAAALRGRFAREGRVQVVTGKAEELTPDALPGPFDSIICFNVLEHISDDVAAVRGFREHLAPGGKLLLLVPAHPLLYGRVDRALGHERRYRKGPLRLLLEKSGFAVEFVRHVNPVGALGWLVSTRILARADISRGPLRLYDRLVPLLRRLDRIEFPFGLSLWAVARRPEHD
jgi:SAM-dependent methyltransferase